MEIIHPCAKSLRHPCATTMGACARSIFQTELARPCAKMKSWVFVHFCLRDVREAVFGLGFLGFSDSRLLGSFGGFSASRLLGLFDGFSTSRLDSAQFLFCQESSPWWPPVSVSPSAKVQSVHAALRGIWCYKVVLLVCESTIILLPVAGGHSGQEPLCLREACANFPEQFL